MIQPASLYRKKADRAHPSPPLGTTSSTHTTMRKMNVQLTETATPPPQLTSPRASARLSTYSMAAPSLTPTVRTTDSADAEMAHIESGLTRMENKALSKQRVVLSEDKAANLNKLALGAKLDRALDRRMSGQDAVMRPRKPRATAVRPGTAEKQAASHNRPDSDDDTENEKRLE